MNCKKCYGEISFCRECSESEQIKLLKEQLQFGVDTVNRLLPELEELRKDKARLDWMISNPDMAVVKQEGKWLILHNPKSKGERFKTPIEAIDAAMKVDFK